MNNTLFPELRALRIEISDDVRDAQFEMIIAALDSTPAAAESPLQRVRSAWRRWAVAAAALTTALVPVAAVASDSAVPGDLLYPVKRTVERIQLVFDGDIDAEHRVDELETLIEQGRPIDVVEGHIRETLDVLAQTSDRSDLTGRVDEAIDRFHNLDESALDRIAPETDAPATDRPSTDEPSSDTESDRTTTTTTLIDDVDDPSDRTQPTEAPDDLAPTTTAPTTDEPETTTTTTTQDGDEGRDGDGGDREDSEEGAGAGDTP